MHITILVALVALVAPLVAMAQAELVASDPMLGLLGSLNLPLLIGLAVLAGVLRQLPVIPASFAIAFPTAGGILFGALGAFYAAAPNPYEIGVAAVITGAGATIVGRSVAAAFEPRTKG